MEQKKILVVDDEQNISDVVKFNLEAEGYNVEVAGDGEEAIKKVHLFQPDLVLLDVMLPILDGFQVCRKIRESFTMPIIMITAKEEEVDKVLAFELGADDYITKPIMMREMLARVRASLRRAQLTKENDTTASSLIVVDEITIDPLRFEIHKNGNLINLTPKEFDLVKFLATNSSQVFTREQLLKHVWGYEYSTGETEDRTVDVTVSRIREKIEEDTTYPKYLLTKRGVGYYFRRN